MRGGWRGREGAGKREENYKFLFHITLCSICSATKTSIRRDSHDTFYSSDEESPLSPIHHAHTNKREEGERSSDEGSSSEEDEKKQEEGRSKVKGGRGGGGVDNDRGNKGDKSESESDSESSSSEEEEGEEDEGLGGGGERAGSKRQELRVVGKSRSKEKVHDNVQSCMTFFSLVPRPIPIPSFSMFHFSLKSWEWAWGRG